MPQMRAAFGGWTTKITMIKRSQSVVNGLVIETDHPLTFKGTVQPLSPRSLMLKPEGQRSWTWLQVHCLASTALNLKPNDRVVFNGELFKVMADLDYSLNNYIEYHLVKDYQGNGASSGNGLASTGGVVS